MKWDGGVCNKWSEIMTFWCNFDEQWGKIVCPNMEILNVTLKLGRTFMAKCDSKTGTEGARFIVIKLLMNIYENFIKILTSKHMHVGSHWNSYKIIFNLIYVVQKSNLNRDSYMHLKYWDIFQKLVITNLMLIDINTLIDNFSWYWYSELNDLDPWFESLMLII